MAKARTRKSDAQPTPRERLLAHVARLKREARKSSALARQAQKLVEAFDADMFQARTIAERNKVQGHVLAVVESLDEAFASRDAVANDVEPDPPADPLPEELLS